MYDVEELKKLLQEEGEQPVSPSKRGPKENYFVVRFIKEHGLEPGNVKLPTYLIYYHFKKWTRTQNMRNKRYGKTEFFRTFKQHFKQVRSGKQRYYLVNDVLDASDETHEKAKKHNKKKITKKD